MPATDVGQDHGGLLALWVALSIALLQAFPIDAFALWPHWAGAFRAHRLKCLACSKLHRKAVRTFACRRPFGGLDRVKQLGRDGQPIGRTLAIRTWSDLQPGCSSTGETILSKAD